MTAKPQSLPALAADDLIAMLDATHDRAELIALLLPMRLPDSLDDLDRARLTSAIVAAASRCWKVRGQR
jgi:hypothetical protein